MLHCCRPLVVFVGLFVLVLAGYADTVRAQTSAPGRGGVFTVSGVPVDVTSSDAATARDQAITEGQRAAFERLFRRLTPDGTPMPTLSDEEVAALVQDFSVDEERTSAVRYLGSLTFRFRPQATRSLLARLGASYTDIQSKPVVVLPVTQTPSGPILWEDRTAWRTAWENAAQDRALVPVVVPYGDLADIADIGAREALDGAAEPITAIASRYGADKVLVALLPDTASSSGVATATLHTLTGERTVETFPVPQSADDPAPDALVSIVSAMGGWLDTVWKQESMIAGAVEGRITVAVPISDLQDWVEIRRRLAQTPTVTRTELRALSRERADLDLHFRGDTDRLRTALTQRDLVLTPLIEGGMTGAQNAPIPGVTPQEASDSEVTVVPLGEETPIVTANRAEESGLWELRLRGQPGFPQTLTR